MPEIRGTIAKERADRLVHLLAECHREIWGEEGLDVYDKGEFGKLIDGVKDEVARRIRDDVEETETILAADLRETDLVKAESAPAWSPIRSIHYSGGEGTGMRAKVTAVVPWGRIIYDADEKVEIPARAKSAVG